MFTVKSEKKEITKGFENFHDAIDFAKEVEKTGGEDVMILDAEGDRVW